MHIAWEHADLAHYYDNHGMVMNPWNSGFRDAPMAESLKRELLQMELYKDVPYRKEDWHHWLGHNDLRGVPDPSRRRFKDVTPYLNPQTAAMGCGLGADVISAYSAYEFVQPG